MTVLFWGLIFFLVTFVPRFFTLMNFGYGYADLGLYSQMLEALSRFQLNPVLLSYGKTYLQVKPQLWIYFLWPFTFFTTSPSLILFVDEVAVLLTAFVCARFAYKKTRSRPLEAAISLAVLFSVLTMDSLHAPTRVTVWAQAPLALFLSEYFERRRALPMALWFGVLCVLDLHFGALILLLVPLLLITQRKRWNLRRRVNSAIPLTVTGVLSLLVLHYLGGRTALETELFWQLEWGILLTWLVSFWFLPLLNLEMVAMGLFLLLLRIDGGVHDPGLLVPLGAIGFVKAFEFLDIKDKWLANLTAAGLVASAFYYNAINADPFFTPWKPSHHGLLAANKPLYDMMAHLPPDKPVLVSDILAPHLAENLSMATLSSPAKKTMQPDYIISINEPTPFDHDPRYQVSEANSSLGARLLKRIK